MIEDAEEANHAAELRKAEAQLNLNEFATGVLGEDAWKFMKEFGRFIAPNPHAGYSVRSKPAAEVRPLIEDLAAGETVPIDMKNPDGKGMYGSRGVRLDRQGQVLVLVGDEEIVALTGRRLSQQGSRTLGGILESLPKYWRPRLDASLPNDEVPALRVPSSSQVPPLRRRQRGEEVADGEDAALGTELTQALISMMTVGANPSPKTARDIAKRVTRLIFKVLGEPGGLDPEPLEARVYRTETIREILGGSYWLAARHIEARQPKGSEGPSASDWKRDGRIFSVDYQGREYFPGYQFDDARQPLPIIEDILRALGPETDPLVVAAWFHYPNGWITRPSADGKTEVPVAPKDALEMPDLVVEAAANRRGPDVA